MTSQLESAIFVDAVSPIQPDAAVGAETAAAVDATPLIDLVSSGAADHAAIRWQDWLPGLYLNDRRSLREVYETLPGAQQDEIPPIVQLLENPASYCAFPGAIALGRHDCLHCLLGRGLHNQDEAFVVGFTMGAATDAKEYHAAEFLRFSSTLYPPTYRFNVAEAAIFRLAFDYSFQNKSIARDIHLTPLEQQMDQTIACLQHNRGIDIAELLSLFQCEKLLNRESKASARLPDSISVNNFPQHLDVRTVQ